MKRVATIFMLCALTTPTFAQAGTITIPRKIKHQWRRIADLQQGSPILVRTVSSSASVPCRLAWIDSNAVACDSPYDGAHDVFPISTVKSIAPVSSRKHHINPVTAVAIGVLGCAIGGIMFDFDGENETSGRLGCLGGASLGVADVYLDSR